MATMDDANEFFDKMSETVDDDDKINVVIKTPHHTQIAIHTWQ